MEKTLVVILVVITLGGFLIHDASGMRLKNKKNKLNDNMPFLANAVRLLQQNPHGSHILEEAFGDKVPTWGRGAWKQMKHMVESHQDDEDIVNDRCPNCQIVLSVLSIISQNSNWTDVRDPWLQLCGAILSVISEYDTDVMCPGIVDLQVYHGWQVLQQLDLSVINPEKPHVRSMCENWNMCFKPRDEIKTSSKTNNKDKMPKTIKKDDSELFKRTMQHQNADWTRDEKDDGDWLEGVHHVMSKIRSGQESVSGEKADVLRVVQLTDIHTDPHYTVGSATDCGLYLCCRHYYEGEGNAGEWGDYACNTPQRTVDLFLSKVADLNPDVVLYSGDSPPQSFWEETFDTQLNCSRQLVDTFLTQMPGHKVYPNIGNHEMFPTNMYYLGLDYTLDMKDALADMWQEVADFGEEQMETMERGSYYTMLVHPGLRVISFNTNYWYVYNWYTTLTEVEDDDEEMWKWVEDTLDAAREADEKVMFLGHHPPGSHDAIVSHTRYFGELMAEYKDVVVLHVAGHKHRDDLRVVRDKEGEPQTVTFVAPSMSPRNYINPSARIFDLDPVTFEVMDYHQYYLDLDNAMESQEEPDIILAYSAKEEYELEDFSPESILDLADRLDKDDELFDLFYYHFRGQTTQIPCGDCKPERICQIQHANYDEMLECMGSYQPPTAPPPTPCPTFEPEECPPCN